MTCHPIPLALELRRDGILPAATVELLLEEHAAPAERERQAPAREVGRFLGLLLQRRPCSPDEQRRAEKELDRLATMAPEEQLAEVGKARTRYSSPALAAMLLDEVVAVIHEDPRFRAL